MGITITVIMIHHYDLLMLPLVRRNFLSTKLSDSGVSQHQDATGELYLGFLATSRAQLGHYMTCHSFRYNPYAESGSCGKSLLSDQFGRLYVILKNQGKPLYP